MEILETQEVSGEGPALTKVGAIRLAIAAGADKPDAGVNYIRKQFGIEIGRQYFSSIKSRLKKSESALSRRSGGPRRRLVVARSTTSPDARVALLTDLEAVKRLIAHHGADNVKRMVDLLG
ncbi:MAG: hypothetical protein KatS3mg108_2959 [Isosphaeraceae bacterium]|jgi:hypothetical protein|nr:MAG: hypothetical protein KatS3mg108_2959 [Isosphaeraceae bacterium]